MNRDDCKYFGENCDTNFGNWVWGDIAITGLVNTMVGLVLLALLCRGAWYFFWYRHRPFCADCLTHNDRVRTTHHYEDVPVCPYHYHHREMADEATYECPKHKVSLEKSKHDGITLDRCPNGCVFLDNGELGELTATARSRGTSTGMLIGAAIG